MDSTQASEHSEARWPRLREHWKLEILAAVWAVSIVGSVAWGVIDVTRAHARAAGDAVDHSDDFVADATRVGERAQLTPRTDPEPLSAVVFQRELGLRRRMVEYEVSYPPAEDAAGAAAVDELDDGPVETQVGQFLDVTASRELDTRYIDATAEHRNGRLLLTVTFDRRSSALGAPGSYVGTISVVDPRVGRVDVPFRVALAFPWWQFVLALLLFMLLPATVYLWYLRGSFTPDAQPTFLGLQEWLFSRNAQMSFGTGVAAAASVWMATYISGETWGGSIAAATALFGATFSSFVAAATAVTAAGADTNTALASEHPDAAGSRVSPPGRTVPA